MNTNLSSVDSNITSQSSTYVPLKAEIKQARRVSKRSVVQNKAALPANTILNDIDLNKEQKESYRLTAHHYHKSNKQLLQQRHSLNKHDYQTKHQQLKSQFTKQIRTLMTSRQFVQYQQNIDDKKSFRATQVQRDLRLHSNSHSNENNKVDRK